MRKDLRPYFIKKIYLKFRLWYTNHFLRPRFDYLGDHPTFMKPWKIDVSGPNVRMGKCATVIGENDAPVKIGVWGHELGKGEITIGDYVLITPGCRISASHQVYIGHSVMMANGVYVTDSDWHGVYDRVNRPEEPTPVHIADNVWLGDHCTVLKGVSIGENSIVGANAVVTKDVPANVVVAGNPAKIVKELDADHEWYTRADYFKDPEAMAIWIDKLDRMVLTENGLFNWLRALACPTTRD